MEYISVRISDLVRQVNRDLYLPAIQRELVWSYEKIEKLFDSIMSDFPIGSFLYWKLQEEKKHDWPVYEFVREYDGESPHNRLANMAGINKDILLVLDGQQRITSLFIGLRGSFRHFRYRWRNTKLYLDLLKTPDLDSENPEEPTYGFSFLEDSQLTVNNEHLWYPVSRVLDFEDAEDAKGDMKAQLIELSEDQRDNANRLIGRLHTRIHTTTVGNYYEERSQDYDKVLQIFIRANSAGEQLEYSDLLLATATATWENSNARDEIHGFTDQINEIGTGFQFRKDFVLKACLYLCETLPIQYKVGNFTQTNLRTIEKNWPGIKDALETTVRLIAKFGFNKKNVVAPLALLPIAFYLYRRGNTNFDESSEKGDVEIQESIRKWFIFSTLKNAFGGSSDTTLTRLRDLLKELRINSFFPSDILYRSLEIVPSLNEAEIERILEYQYQGRYTDLILSLLYPDRYWKDTALHVDHIFPKREFNRRSLRSRGFSDDKVEDYMSKYNAIGNLQLLTASENLDKKALDFDDWLSTRDESFSARHIVPDMNDYSFSKFDDFVRGRESLIVSKFRTFLNPKLMFNSAVGQSQ